MLATVSQSRGDHQPDPGLERGRGLPASRRLVAPPVSELAAVSSRRGLGLQARLEVGRSDDPLEHEADRVAERLTAAPPGLLRRACACGGTPGPDGECAACKARRLGLQRRAAGDGPGHAPAIVHEVLGSPGRPLDSATRTDMEGRLGRDLGDVRVHTGDRAAASSRAVGALAYTVGSDVVFERGRYAPRSPEGRRLLAHELAHVAQQSARRPLVQRQGGGMGGGLSIRGPTSRPPGATACGIPGHCPPSFCQPYTNIVLAHGQRLAMMPGLLAGIASQVDSRVVPLWMDHLLGGSAPQNLTSAFAGDFERSRSTRWASERLARKFRESLMSSPPAFSPGTTEIIVPLSPRIRPALDELNDPTHGMNFGFPEEVPGNIAGDVGHDQLTCQMGAMPSPFDDLRSADGVATLTRDAAGTLTVALAIDFLVKDTVDLCPANCGTDAEQIATVPMSWFEATGIAGDVPFWVEFSVKPPPFVIPGFLPPTPVGPPAPGPTAPPSVGPAVPTP